MEVWDGYDKNLNKIEGLELVRGEKIPEGAYHLVCDVLVRHKDGDFLIMQREAKKSFGGMWEATAGGSALKGESALDCAKRELFEETGISNADLKEVGMVVHHGYKTIFVEFFCETDVEKSKIVLQEGETQAYEWVSLNRLLTMKREELLTDRMQAFISSL